MMNLPCLSMPKGSSYVLFKNILNFGFLMFSLSLSLTPHNSSLSRLYLARLTFIIPLHFGLEPHKGFPFDTTQSRQLKIGGIGPGIRATAFKNRAWKHLLLFFSFFFFGNGKRKFILSILYQSLHFERVTVTHVGFNLLFAFPGF